MSEKLEAKNLPLVTSLSDTDTILAVGADGNGKRIEQNNVGRYYSGRVNLGSGEKWIRVLTFNGGTCGGVFTFWNEWYNKHPDVLVFAFGFPASLYSAQKDFQIKALIAGLGVFDKVRLIYKNTSSVASDSYLEIHQKSTGEQVYFMDIPSNIRNAVPKIELGSIPEGYTSIEYNIADILLGGVKRYTYFAEWRKGGWHECTA